MTQLLIDNNGDVQSTSVVWKKNNGGLKFAQEYHGADEEQKKQWYEMNSSLIEKGKSATVTSKQR